MKMWCKIIEDNREAVTDAMQKAARASCGIDGKSVLRVELYRNGTVNTYHTFPGLASNAVRDGVAFPIRDYYGIWNEKWADTYDADSDLKKILQDLYQMEKEIIDSYSRRSQWTSQVISQ